MPGSTIADLGTETLSRIFWFATTPAGLWIANGDDSIYDLSPGPPLSDENTFFRLCGVCTRWRHIAHACSDIHVSITIGHFEHEVSADDLGFPWSRVRTLEAKDVSLDTACRFLTLCQNLVKVLIDYRTDLPGDDALVLDAPGIITMKSVQSLSLVASSSFDSDADEELNVPTSSLGALQSNVFGRFRFPALRSLRWDAPLPSDYSRVRDFFEGMTQIREFHCNPSSTRYCLDQYLDLFRNVTTLVMKVQETRNLQVRDLLQRMTIKPGFSGNLFPRLESLC
ncbi:hypothetical protein NP233_g12388 [Leucocoprinus birnbaumii]|uniref:Uncharacterized protein n=1 Tax=Leucocoprinus birnbaumii TaxID=56174 RepID=A0AAD5YQ18_9AGAR|nr:hypothetical protein NP233_g12388 [Leucocoprinus birnbaumii]